MKINNNIIVYEPCNELSLEEFVRKYSDAYSATNPKMQGICYKQTDIDIEDAILASDVYKIDNFIKKMCWKIGCKENNPQSYGRRVNLALFYGKLHVKELSDLCEIQKKDEIIEIIKKRKVFGIGPVYIIAVLFFVSNGKYPIYDRFADCALHYMFEEKDYPRRGDSKRFISANALKNYDRYSCRIEELLKMLHREGANYIEYRDLDRALWGYGHGYTDNYQSYNNR